MAKEGYLFVDHRASPGLPEDVAKRAGYDPFFCREGKLFEADTMRCMHCSSHVIKNPERTRARESCMQCGGAFICDPCAFKARQPGYIHTPWSRMIDLAKEAEAKGLPFDPMKVSRAF